MKKEPSKILGDSPPNLPISWSRSSIFHIQKIAELSKSCQTSWIQKKGQYNICRGQATGAKTAISGQKAKNYIGKSHADYYS